MDEDDLEDLQRDYWTRPKQVCRDVPVTMMMMIDTALLENLPSAKQPTLMLYHSAI